MKLWWILSVLGSLFFVAQTHNEMEMEDFQSCLLYCSDAYGNCLKATEGLWKDYIHNREKITRIVRRCCLRNEKNPDAHEEDSFATCAKIRCGAHLYGCQIKKVHEGFMSPEEIFHLKEKQNKTQTVL
uniref:Uncharacterized protein n=1 Tax=Schistocephalus solidus TaxID=70667 RepID=A0A0X3Q4W8_SCHSO